MPELDDVDPREWDAILDAAGLRDVNARRGYVHASALLESGKAKLLHLEGGRGSVSFPLIRRNVPGVEGLRDVTTPYGYGGPLGAGSAPPWEAFHEAYDRWCRRTGVVSSFVRFHPRYANHATAGATTELRPLAGVVGWRLEGARDLFAEMHSHHRRLVRKATAAGVTATVIERPDSLDEFRQTYEATMQRLRASTFYFFDRPYWDALTTGLREHLVLVESRIDGHAIASILCLGSAPWLYYHLGASDARGRSLGANHLAVLEAARWAQSRGYTIFNLGGGVGGAVDPLLTFKTRFDPNGLLPAFLGTQINDAEAYRVLSGSDRSDGFFPAYRADPTSSHGVGTEGRADARGR